MFNKKNKVSKEEFELLKEVFESLQNSGQTLYNNFIECNECGMVIFKNTAIKKKFIEIVVGYEEIFGGEITKEECVEKYFCKKCGAKYKIDKK